VKHSRAFTLIELVVTIAVLAIVMGLAVPGFNSFIQSNRVTGHANGMVSALAFARSEAVNRSEQVRFCPVNAAGNGCDDDGDWSTGWIALVQSGPDAGEVLRIWPPVPGQPDPESPDRGCARFKTSSICCRWAMSPRVTVISSIAGPTGRPIARPVARTREQWTWAAVVGPRCCRRNVKA
jgi:type IV fimbrial biogenesis protein FimT